MNYYVYKHVDPLTKSIIYIGHGKLDRAWTFRPTTLNQISHYEHLIELSNAGYTPQDWVKLHKTKLTKEQAKDLEKRLIYKHQPIYNKQRGIGSLTNKDKINMARNLRNTGLSYTEIAKKMGLKSSMTAWRYASYGK